MKKYLNNRKLITCKCDNTNCNKEFQKPESEYKRNLSKGRKNFCSRSCVGQHYVNTGVEVIPPKHIRVGDEFTPFRSHLRRTKSRDKDFKLTLIDLKNIWEKQNAICPYSGVKLELVSNQNPIYSASLDRIDSTKGYTLDNIQFVSQAINYMKNTMSHEQTLLLCSLIAKNQSLLS